VLPPLLQVTIASSFLSESTLSFAAGSRLGPFEILGLLGAGGMGEVYRARDTRLDRTVAIKVLPSHLSENPDRKARFEREARAISRLTHPHICTLYDMGHEGGVDYLVMECLEGETLADRLQEGPFPTDQLLKTGIEIGEGLEWAHHEGIIHRDLKPANVMLTKTGAKLLDFGLAKAGDAADFDRSESPTRTADPSLTDPGTVMGTLSYLAPEQLEGKKADARTDIFAFGVILYEMATGRKPFAGTSKAGLIGSILKDEPPPITKLAPMAPPALDRLIRQCLEKDPEERWHSVHDVVKELTWIRDGARGVATFGTTLVARPRKRAWLIAGIVAVVVLAVPSFLMWRGKSARGPVNPTRMAQDRKPARIVVLPFENLGPPQDAYFAAGVTEEIMSRLASLQGLAVISRTTAIGYDRKGKTIPQIGADLGVDFVLEGTVRWDRSRGGEGRVRIAPQLILVADDTPVWADRYDRVTAHVLAIQSDVAENVVRAMGVKLAPREQTVLKTASTSDMEAYDLYLRGLEMLRRGQTRQNLEEAVRLFRAATDQDPGFAPALAQLAQAHLKIYFLHLDRSRERVDSAKQVVERLLGLGPDLAESQIARAYYSYWGLSNYPRALEEFKAALALQPSNGDVRYGIAAILRRQGQWEEAAEQQIKLLEIDPRSPEVLFEYGLTCLLLRRYAEADRAHRLSASLNRQFGNPWGYRVWTQILWRGDVERAESILSEAGQVVDLEDGAGRVAWASFRVALIRRDFQGALRHLEGETRGALANQFFYLPVELLRGEAHALSGRRDLASQSFEAARRRLQELILKEPDDSRYYSALGIACAGLGLRQEALRAANRGAELMPRSKDAWRSLHRLEDLALVHAMLGQQNEAIEVLDSLLSRAGYPLSVHVLRLDPLWDPLRSSPRFEALLAKYGDKT
jgi:TolB-like protein/tetratricopeptide (TPR) repeat protein